MTDISKSILQYLRVCIFGCGAAILAAATTPAAAENYALIIGISQYQSSRIPGLRYADVDATSVAMLLQQSGAYEPQCVVLLLNEHATQSGIINALDGLDKRCAVEGANDKALIYFAGHGIDADAEMQKLAGQSKELLAPYDAVPGRGATTMVLNSGEENRTFIPKDWLITQLAELDASEISVVLDSCSSGFSDFTSDMNQEIARAQHGANSSQPSRRAALLAATAAGATEQEHDMSYYGDKEGFENDGGHGALSFAILDSLYRKQREGIPENEVRPVTVAELYGDVVETFEKPQAGGHPLDDYSQPQISYFPADDSGHLMFAKVRGRKKIVVAVNAPPPPAVPAAPREQEQFGSIYVVTSLPSGSFVKINGEIRKPGEDGTIQLRADSDFVVVIGVPQWHYQDVRSVRVAPGQRLGLEVATEGTLSIESRDGDDDSKVGPPINIYVDGESIGREQSFRVDHLLAGAHIVRATIANEDESTEIEIRPDSPLKVVYRIHYVKPSPSPMPVP